jgi:alanine racemase
MHFDNTYVKIDLDAVAENFEAVCRKAGGKKVMAVIKADAYGHGAIQIARLLQGKCAFFGVSSILEARELRQNGIPDPILILGHAPSSAFELMIKENIRPTIFRRESAEALSRAAVKLGKTAKFHFAVDTGMSRLGFQVTEEDADTCAAIAALPGLEAEGLFSHFATADCQDLTRSHAQAALFARFDDMLKERGIHIPIRHMDNSAGILNFDTRYEMVRSGIVTYGMYPSTEVPTENLKLRPALQWVSRIVNLRLLPPGREISYGGTFVTERPTLVATVPVGYADGYCRSLSGKFYVLIRGRRAPILGRICMDQMMVDVTDIPDVRQADPVILVGSSGGEAITMEAISAAADSFNYEFVCGISRRVPRIYYQGGQEVSAVHYLLDT